MRIARRAGARIELLAPVLLFLILSARLSLAQLAEVREAQAIESAVLHRRLDLSALRQWDRAGRTWRPLLLPPYKLLVLNLWSIHCIPCLREFTIFTRIVGGWRDRPEVLFLFIADPPDETTESDVVDFWRHPLVTLPPGSVCPRSGGPVRRAGPVTCLLDLPDVDPVRSPDHRIRRTLGTEKEPLTLLVDLRGIVRQGFAGSLQRRNEELAAGIDRLLQVLEEGPGGKRPVPGH